MFNIKQNLLYVLLTLVFFKLLVAAEDWYEALLLKDK
jgi:hypothetical protein